MAEKEEGKAEESMEEILHSIRDIIAEEDDDLPPAETAEEQPENQDAEEEVLELTDVVEDTQDESGDVLADIDAALGTEDDEPSPEEAAISEPVPESEEEKADTEAVQEAVEEVHEEMDSLEKAVEDIQENQEPIQETVDESESKESLVSTDTAIATSSTLQQLINSIPKPASDAPQFRGGHTIEDLTIEALKPMLKEWLDDNLQVVVEDLLQKEIRKLIPKD